MKSFIESQFAYSPLVWMFHDRHISNKINKIHERSLIIVYKGDISSFEELLLKDNSISTHHRNIHALAIKMYERCYAPLCNNAPLCNTCPTL